MARIRRHRRDSVQSPLETYLREINEVALLTADDEKMLAHRIAQGDNAARERMVRANLRLVVNIARGYVGKGLALQDLIEEGNLGLLRAVEGFDPAVGTRFSTYASYWIKQSIKRALVNTAKPIRIPAYMVELLFKWRRAAADLAEGFGRPATVDEIAKELGLPKKKLAIVKKAIKVYNLVPQTDQPENGWSLGEMLMDERTKAPDVEMVEADNLMLVLRRREEMDKREATVLRMRSGSFLDGIRDRQSRGPQSLAILVDPAGAAKGEQDREGRGLGDRGRAWRVVRPNVSHSLETEETLRE